MTIKEMEVLSGLGRSNIRFYEAQGLLAPQRRDNGYRDYTQENLTDLLRIKLLRTVGVPLEDIKDLQTGAVTLGDLLARHLEDLKTQQGHLQRSMEICRAMQGADYATLDAALYLSQLEREAAAALAQDKIDRVDIPWRRFFARHLDWTLCTDVVVAIPLFFGLDLRTQGIGGLVVILAAGLGLVYLLEPRLLARWGTTPGKLLWGIRVTDLEGQRLGRQAALSRTQGVIVQGMGLQIPIYNLWRWCRCYIENQEGKEMTWEEDSMLTLKDRKAWRPILFLAALGVLYVGMAGVDYAAELPWHRGEITVEDFCANYNRATKVLQMRNGWELTGEGTWKQVPVNVHTSLAGGQPPEVTFAVEDGKMTGLSFPMKNEWLSDYYRVAASMKAFVQAQRGYSILDNRDYEELLERLLDRVSSEAVATVPPVEGELAGVAVSLRVEEGNRMVFRMEKVG